MCIKVCLFTWTFPVLNSHPYKKKRKKKKHKSFVADGYFEWSSFKPAATCCSHTSLFCIQLRLQLHDTSERQLELHWGNIKPTLFFLLCDSLCVRLMLRRNADMLWRGKVLLILQEASWGKPRDVFPTGQESTTANSNIPPSKEGLLLDRLNFNPHDPPCQTDRKHSAGLPAFARWRMSTFSEEDEIEKQKKTFCLVKDVSSLLFPLCRTLVVLLVLVLSPALSSSISFLLFT